MALGSTYKTGQEAPVSGIYRCEQCEKAGVTNDLPLAKDDNFPPVADVWQMGDQGDPLSG